MADDFYRLNLHGKPATFNGPGCTGLRTVGEQVLIFPHDAELGGNVFSSFGHRIYTVCVFQSSIDEPPTDSCIVDFGFA